MKLCVALFIGTVLVAQIVIAREVQDIKHKNGNNIEEDAQGKTPDDEAQTGLVTDTESEAGSDNKPATNSDQEIMLKPDLALYAVNASKNLKELSVQYMKEAMMMSSLRSYAMMNMIRAKQVERLKGKHKKSRSWTKEKNKAAKYYSVL